MNIIINKVLFLYIFSLFFFDNIPGLNNVTNFSAVLYILLVILELLAEKKKVIISKNIIYLTLLTIMAVISISYSIDKNIAITRSITLLSNYFLMLAIVNHIKNEEIILKALSQIVFSGTAASLFLLISSIGQIGINRIGMQLGAVNRIAMIVAIAFVISLFFVIYKKKRHYIVPLMIMGIVILLAGSRNALIFIMISSLILLHKRYNFSMKEKLKFAFFSSLFFSLIYVLVFNVSVLYSIIGIRIESMFSFIKTGEAIEEKSIVTRSFMAKFGFDIFKEKPILGHGIDNYRVLYYGVRGTFSYAHSDLIDLLVGLGVVGVLLYYLNYITVIINLKKIKLPNKDITYLFIALTISLLTTSFTTIHYYLKYYYLVISLIISYITIYKKNNNDRYI